MKTQHIVEELKRAAEQLGLQVRVDRGNFRGGRCTVGEEEMVVLNRHHLPEVHLVILAESLRDLPTESIFLRPAVREALEEAWRRGEQVEGGEIDADE
jgi:hypothetical protein